MCVVKKNLARFIIGTFRSELLVEMIVEKWLFQILSVAMGACIDFTTELFLPKTLFRAVEVLRSSRTIRPLKMGVPNRSEMVLWRKLFLLFRNYVNYFESYAIQKRKSRIIQKCTECHHHGYWDGVKLTCIRNRNRFLRFPSDLENVEISEFVDSRSYRFTFEFRVRVLLRK